MPGTGGLVEGVKFNGRGLKDLASINPPPGAIDPRAWSAMLKINRKAGFEAYIKAVLAVFSQVEASEGVPSNAWPLSGSERKHHEEYVGSKGFAEAKT